MTANFQRGRGASCLINSVQRKCRRTDPLFPSNIPISHLTKIPISIAKMITKITHCSNTAWPKRNEKKSKNWCKLIGSTPEFFQSKNQIRILILYIFSLHYFEFPALLTGHSQQRKTREFKSNVNKQSGNEMRISKRESKQSTREKHELLE